MIVLSDMGTDSNQSSFYEVPKQRTDIITDEEFFNAADLKEAAAELDKLFSDFADILMELNDLVNSRVNASCDECIFGAGYGAQLLTMWNNNVPTFSDFKANFESWSRAVSVIATRNENTEAAVAAIYAAIDANRTTGADLTTSSGKTVSEMREDILLDSAKVYSSTNSRGGNTYKYYDENGNLTTKYTNADGEVWMQHISDENGKITSTVCTDSEGNISKIEFQRDSDGNVIEKSVTFYDKNGNVLENAPNSFKEDGYLVSSSSEKSTENIETSTGSSDDSSSAATDSYFIQTGDKCTVYGQDVTFFARDGSYNYYKDANGQIFIDADGGLRSLDVNESMWNTNYLKDPSGYYGAVTTTAEGASEMNLPNVDSSSNVPYDDYGMSEFVDSRTISTDNAKTYTTNEGFRQDILSSDNRPQVVEFDHTLESSGWDIITPDISTGADGKVTLVYDDRAGKYYTLDENGSYVRDGYGYTPEELAKYDIEKYQ